MRSKFHGMTPDEFKAMMVEKYNRKNFRGLELRNANGDISPASLEYNYATDRLTYIRSRSVEQSFYEILPSDYFSVIPGEGAFSQQIITNLTVKTAGGFASGKINTAKGNSSLGIADAAVTPFYTMVQNWALAIDYTVFDIEQSMFSGNWDIVEAKHAARKTDWDLGIQGVAFLGDIDNLTQFPGLYTQSSVTNNTAVITKKISDMSDVEFQAFVKSILAAYLLNANQTRWPNKFVIPQDDYAGLGTAASSTYPNITKLAYLTQVFKMIVPGGKFEILPNAYGMATYNAVAGVNKARYVLYRDDIDTLFMELPVDYQTTQVGTLNNFQYQDAAYGQYAGVSVLKPREMIYFSY